MAKDSRSKALDKKKGMAKRMEGKVYKVPIGGYIENGKVVDPYKKGRKEFSRMHEGIKKGFM